MKTSSTPDEAPAPTAIPCLLSLSMDVLTAMLNFELADHPVYDGGELQWFDDEVHGTGMLAFLSRRADRTVDYYVQPGLRLDRGGYELGGGTGAWTETEFDAARLHVTDVGVDAEARFTDRDGRAVEIRVDDRDGRARRRGGLLAPVSASIERPRSLLLVWMPGFDLVRGVGAAPVIRIDGRDAAIGRLPGARLHRRHLIKVAGPLVTVEVNPDIDRFPPQGSGAATAELVAARLGHRARLRLWPPVPAPHDLPTGASLTGRWSVEVDGTTLTGGTWCTERTGERVDYSMNVDRPWRPQRLPLLMRIVTTFVPVFRRWPTTYRWRAMVDLGQGRTTAHWERTTSERGMRYRRVTRS